MSSSTCHAVSTYPHGVVAVALVWAPNRQKEGLGAQNKARTRADGVAPRTVELASAVDNSAPYTATSDRSRAPASSEWDAPRIYVKPREQLQLTEKELNEEVTVALRANNPEAPVNFIHLSYTRRGSNRSHRLTSS